jgi:predicted transcriptional regulator YdeE
MKGYCWGMVLLTAIFGLAAGIAWCKESALEPRIVDMPQMVFVGVVQGAPDVGQIDIGAMWHRFGQGSDKVPNTVEGAGYEIHVGITEEPAMHYCLTGVQVSELGAIPYGMFAKVLPQCTYAVFTHHVVDGYPKLIERVNAWFESSDYEEAHPYDFQLYDSRFTSMDDPESVQDIYVPVRLK